MPFIQRENNVIVGVYANFQEGYAEEEVADDNAELEAFRNRPMPVALISRRQFFQQAAVSGIITETEALAAVTTGVLPSAIAVFIGALPAEQQFGAKMLFSVNEFERSSPMANAFGQTLGMTSEQIDAFFTAAASL